MSNIDHQESQRCDNTRPCVDVVTRLQHADRNAAAGIPDKPLREKAARTAAAHLEGHRLFTGGRP